MFALFADANKSRNYPHCDVYEVTSLLAFHNLRLYRWVGWVEELRHGKR